MGLIPMPAELFASAAGNQAPLRQDNLSVANNDRARGEYRRLNRDLRLGLMDGCVMLPA